ncbi:MAG: hypothetical protein WD771_10145 [Gemmatimonadaceae bacterium]
MTERAHHDLSDAWDALWSRLSVRRVPVEAFQELVAHYAADQRSYHGLAHLRDCLAHLDGVRRFAVRPDEVELALWFHDAIYDPAHGDNEQRSAAWAAQVAADAGLAREVVERVSALVMATRHDEAPSDPDARLLCDVDLAILGASDERFDEYERQIRAEYAWVPDQPFRERRATILEALLRRPSIFGTPYFHDRYETAARRNLTRSLAQLRAGRPREGEG